MGKGPHPTAQLTALITDQEKDQEQLSLNRRRRLWGKPANPARTPALTALVFTEACGMKWRDRGVCRVFRRFHRRWKTGAPSGAVFVPSLATAVGRFFRSLPQTLRRPAMPGSGRIRSGARLPARRIHRYRRRSTALPMVRPARARQGAVPRHRGCVQVTPANALLPRAAQVWLQISPAVMPCRLRIAPWLRRPGSARTGLASLSSSGGVHPGRGLSSGWHRWRGRLAVPG